MSYLSPQTGDFAASHDHQPNDMPRSGWGATPNSLQADHGLQDTPWPFRQPPRLRLNPRT